MASEQLFTIARELYGGSPDSFVAARDAAAKRARAQGDAALATQVRQLRRPSVAAWAVNLLVRERTDLVLQVLELGESMRQAQALLQGDQLRDLTRRRRQLVAAVTTEARTLAAAAGQRLSDQVARQVEETLQAAMADRQSAAAVRSGLLAQPLVSTGMGSLADALAVTTVPVEQLPAPEPGEPVRLSVVPDRDREREEATARAAEAARAAVSARDVVDDARRRKAKRQATVLQVEAELDEVRRRAAELEHARDRAADRLAAAEESLASAEADYADARRHADDAAAALDRLDTRP